MVLTRAGRATHLTLQVRVQRKPNTGRRHPSHSLTDRPTRHPMTAGHHHCRPRRMTTQAGPLQHRPRASLQRTQHPPRQLRHRIRHRPRGQRQPIPDNHPRHPAPLPSVLSAPAGGASRGQPASGWGQSVVTDRPMSMRTTLLLVSFVLLLLTCIAGGILAMNSRPLSRGHSLVAPGSNSVNGCSLASAGARAPRGPSRTADPPSSSARRHGRRRRGGDPLRSTP